MLLSGTALLSISSPRVITPEYLDDYGNHLNEALALVIFEEERIKILPKEQMLKHGVLAVVHEQHAKYHSQVFDGDSVEVKTLLLANRARLHFLHQMIRGDELVLEDLVEVVMINSSGKPTRIPLALLQEVLSSHS